jgi:CHAT domain-containing protein
LIGAERGRETPRSRRTPGGARSFLLPPVSQIDVSVRRYREALVNGEDVLANSNQDGLQLYQTLIAPAASLLTNESRVIVVADGSLSSLNFETLLVPGTPHPHYWIEDAVLSNAQSLRLLAAKKITTRGRAENVLLMGDALPHNPEYPALPNARLEIENVGKHFAPAALTTFTQSAETASAFLESSPEQYSYIHFVAHAVASSQVPLDSAVILSPQSGEDSFKLYARDIVQHRLRAGWLRSPPATERVRVLIAARA